MAENKEAVLRKTGKSLLKFPSSPPRINTPFEVPAAYRLNASPKARKIPPPASNMASGSPIDINRVFANPDSCKLSPIILKPD